MRQCFAWLVVSGSLVVAGCGSSPSPDPHFKIGSPYRINGTWYYPEAVSAYEATGIAAWDGAS